MTDSPLKNYQEDICPKCGKKGCTCGPECTCDDNSAEGAMADITKLIRQRNLIQDFEE